MTWQNAAWTRPDRPYSIAHRGASAYASDGTVDAFETAARLGADMWEVDIRLAQCGTLISYHDATLPDGRAIGDLSAMEIAEVDCDAVPFTDIVVLAKNHDAGIYADIKDTAASIPVMQMLQEAGIERAILGAFDPDAARLLKEANSPYPSSALVPIGADPFDHARHADVIHLCWERMDAPQDHLNKAFFERVESEGKRVVLWHEEDPNRMAVLRKLPVLGICSDRPELVHPWQAPPDWPVEIVCHRGACEFAPENTLSAANCAFAGGFDFVELDVRETSDGHHVVLHDRTLDRTTDSSGEVADHTLSQLCKMDAGGWYKPHFAGEKLPTLSEIIDIAELYDRSLYVELKRVNVARVLEEIGDRSRFERCFFWSFKHDLLEEFHKQAPDARFMLRRQDFDTLDGAMFTLPTEIIEYEFGVDIDTQEFDRCRSEGKKVMIAYMGRDLDIFRQIADLRPDMVNLHFPYAFRDFLKTYFPGDR